MATALLSSSVALIVAVLGIAGAVAAQLVATRRAYANSLSLFERHHAEQEAARREEVRRDNAYRFAEQRRSIYGRFVRLAREFIDAVDAERTVAKNLERIARQRDRSPERSLDLEMSAEAAEQLVADARERKWRLDGEFGTTSEELQLLGSPEVRQVADHLWDVAHEVTHSADDAYMTARVAFLEAARQELGIVTSSSARQSAHQHPFRVNDTAM